MTLRTLKNLDVKGKTVLCRVDLNVPIIQGKVEDATRITKIIPTIENLTKRGARVVLLSHFGRPKGEYNREMSLAPLTNYLSEALDGKPIGFAIDCIGEAAENAVAEMEDGGVLLLENLRFHAGEEKNNPRFTESLAKLGDAYVNDTFSCSHRAHASIVGLAKKLPSAAGLLLQSEVESLQALLGSAEHPMAAIVAGSKVSTKLALLQTLVKKVDMLVIGGAMANTFLKAKGYAVGKSLYEKDLVSVAKDIILKAEKANCEIFLPSDAVVARELKEQPECQIVDVDKVPADQMILDLGPETIAALHEKLKSFKTVVWNGPVGAFEFRPFDVASISIARSLASLTANGTIKSVAGGGDVLAALSCAGLQDSFTYLSTAGGAFLEWLEGAELPGVASLSD